MKGIAVGLFGAYYPEYRRAGNSTTGLAFCLSQSESIQSLVVFAQHGSSVPPGDTSSKVRVEVCWRFDDPASLILSLLRMLSYRSTLHGYIFNIYMTSFGRSRVANAFGLSMPSVLSLVSRRRVICYMHNFVETQPIEKLGYSGSSAARLLARVLEKALLRFTTVLVPLESQAETISKELHGDARALFFPYVEVAPDLIRQRSPKSIGATAFTWPPDRMRVLLFGNWGPQKELGSCLRALSEASLSVGSCSVCVAGGVNPSFPDYAVEYHQLMQSYQSDRVTFLGPIDQGELVGLVASADLIVLPYAGAGGYSGAMNVAAAFDRPVLASDLPQLRETAMLLGLKADYYMPGSMESMKAALLGLSFPGSQRVAAIDGVEKLALTMRSVQRLIDELEGG